MKIWVKSIGIGLVAAGIGFFVSQKTDKTMRVPLYDATYTLQATIRDSTITLSKIISILEKRAGARYEDFLIKQGPGNTVLVSLKGITDTTFIDHMLTSGGHIRFTEVYSINEMVPPITKAVVIHESRNRPAKEAIAIKKDGLSKNVQALLDSMDAAEEKARLIEDDNTTLISFENSYSLNSAVLGKVKLKDTATVSRLLMEPEVRALSPADLTYAYGKVEQKIRANGKETFYLYAIKNTGYPLIENEDIEAAQQDYDAIKIKPIITVRFSAAGARKWSLLTRKNAGKCIAIVVDNEVISAPQVLEEITSESSDISGNFSLTECQTLAEILNSQPLPARLSILSSSIKQVKAPFSTRRLLSLGLLLLLFSALGYFIFKTLKAT